MVIVATPSVVDRVWDILDTVPDPEIPVVSVVDLGIVRDVKEVEGGVEICVSPTYSGCPATEVIERSIIDAVQAQHISATVIPSLSPPWTTDWISDRGRDRLLAYGIAPPPPAAPKGALLAQNKIVMCPRCHSEETELISQFGSTPCKAHYRCNDCLEPFDHFKCI